MAAMAQNGNTNCYTNHLKKRRTSNSRKSKQKRAEKEYVIITTKCRLQMSKMDKSHQGTRDKNREKRAGRGGARSGQSLKRDEQRTQNERDSIDAVREQKQLMTGIPREKQRRPPRKKSQSRPLLLPMPSHTQETGTANMANALSPHRPQTHTLPHSHHFSISVWVHPVIESNLHSFCFSF